jgi:hypothetical protein
LRKAISRRSAGVPLSGMSAGGGNRIRPHHTAAREPGGGTIFKEKKTNPLRKAERASLAAATFGLCYRR